MNTRKKNKINRFHTEDYYKVYYDYMQLLIDLNM